MLFEGIANCWGLQFIKPLKNGISNLIKDEYNEKVYEVYFIVELNRIDYLKIIGLMNNFCEDYALLLIKKNSTVIASQKYIWDKIPHKEILNFK